VLCRRKSFTINPNQAANGRKGAVLRPKVYIVVVHYHNWRDTVECLESLRGLAYDNFRVLVADNGSSDESRERLAAWASAGGPAVEILHPGENLGFAGANNLALRHARQAGDGAYAWLLNSDTAAEPDALDALVDQAETDARVAFVGSKLLRYDRPNVLELLGGGRWSRWTGLTHHAMAGQIDFSAPAPADLDFVCGASLLVRLAALDPVGPMDEGYFLYGEDLDWCLRARAAGWKLAVAPASRVRHKGGGAVGARSCVQDYYSVRAALLTVRRFFPWALPTAAACAAARSLLPKLLRCQGRRLLAAARGWRDGLLGRAGRCERY